MQNSTKYLKVKSNNTLKTLKWSQAMGKKKQGEFIPSIQGWFNIPKSINITDHINKIKYDHHMVISIDADKALDKTEYLFTLLTNWLLKGIYLNIIKAIYEKPTTNIISMIKKPKGFFWRSGTRQACLLSPPLFYIILQVLAKAVSQSKEINKKKTSNRKGRSNIISVHRRHDLKYIKL